MSEYEKGALDCAKGLLPKEGASGKYMSGYADQYIKEQIESNRTQDILNEKIV